MHAGWAQNQFAHVAILGRALNVLTHFGLIIILIMCCVIFAEMFAETEAMNPGA